MQLVCIHVEIWTTLLREEKALKKATHGGHFVYVHLRKKKKQNVFV